MRGRIFTAQIPQLPQANFIQLLCENFSYIKDSPTVRIVGLINTTRQNRVQITY